MTIFNKTILSITSVFLLAICLSSSSILTFAQSGTSGGTITIGLNPQSSSSNNSTTIKPESIKIDDPYTCGKDIHGRAVSATLGKIITEVTNSTNSYKFFPAFDANGNYSFVPTENGVIPGLYTVTYYAETTSGLQSDKFSYQADIKLLKDCVAGANTTTGLLSNGTRPGSTTSSNPSATSSNPAATSNNPLVQILTSKGTNGSTSFVNAALNTVGLVRSGGAISVISIILVSVLTVAGLMTFKKSKNQ
jgi:hypothetical protein